MQRCYGHDAAAAAQQPKNEAAFPSNRKSSRLEPHQPMRPQAKHAIANSFDEGLNIVCEARLMQPTPLHPMHTMLDAHRKPVPDRRAAMRQRVERGVPTACFSTSCSIGGCPRAVLGE